MGDSYRLVQSNSPVKYQEKSFLQDWHRLHIQLNEYEYDYCLDKRKLYKMSVLKLMGNLDMEVTPWNRKLRRVIVSLSCSESRIQKFMIQNIKDLEANVHFR